MFDVLITLLLSFLAILFIEAIIDGFTQTPPQSTRFMKRVEAAKRLMADRRRYEIAENFEQNLRKYLPVMSKSQYKKYEGLILGTVWVDEFTTDEIAEWEAKLQEYEAFNRRIELTAERNNDGIEAEKKGDINGAIRLYEENVRDKVVATHSYDRLAIIYRRLKRYEDEIRVIKTALEVFGQENERRFKQAIETCRDQETLEAIKLARETCGTVRRPDGQVVYNPYPVMKWISRLSKSESLLQKSI